MARSIPSCLLDQFPEVRQTACPRRAPRPDFLPNLVLARQGEVDWEREP